jgi:hypothetical protein
LGGNRKEDTVELRASSHEAGMQEQVLSGRDLVGRSWSCFFRWGCGCLWPHHSKISAMLTWLCPWKEKCAGGFSTEVTRNSEKRLSFCVTGQCHCSVMWPQVVSHFSTSTHTYFPSCQWTVHMPPTHMSFHVGQRNKWGLPVKLLVRLPASRHVKRL